MVTLSFKPVMVENKKDLDSIPKNPGQYIVVTDAGELYLDKIKGQEVIREKTSQNIYLQPESAEAPKNAKEGDLWFVIAD